MAPLTFEIPPGKPTFEVKRGEDGYVDLIPTEPIRTHNGRILAFCLPRGEAIALAAQLLDRSGNPARD